MGPRHCAGLSFLLCELRRNGGDSSRDKNDPRWMGLSSCSFTFGKSVEITSHFPFPDRQKCYRLVFQQHSPIRDAKFQIFKVNRKEDDFC